MNTNTEKKVFKVNQNTELYITWLKNYDENCLTQLATSILNEEDIALNFKKAPEEVLLKCGIEIKVYQNGELTNKSILDVIDTKGYGSAIAIGVVIGLCL